MTQKVKDHEGQRAPKGKRPLRAKGPKGWGAPKDIGPPREKSPESLNSQKRLYSDNRGRGSRTRTSRTSRTPILTTRSARLRRQLKIGYLLVKIVKNFETHPLELHQNKCGNSKLKYFQKVNEIDWFLLTRISHRWGLSWFWSLIFRKIFEKL